MKSEPVIFHAPFLHLMYDIQQQPLLFPSARALLFPGSVIDDVFPQ